jgi:gliding motility-associated-like protein
LASPIPDLQLKVGRGCEPLCQWYNPRLADSVAAIVTIDFGGLNQFQIPAYDSVNFCLPAGEHFVKVVAKGQNGCTGRYQYPYPIIVDPKPGSSIHHTPEQPNTTEEVVFEAHHAKTDVTYQRWLFQGGLPSVIDTSYKGGASDTTNDNYPRRRYNNFGTYPVMLITANEFGCYDTVVKFLKVIDLMSLFIPDAFTPNDDGVNDVFTVKGMGIEEEGFTMDIFNRKGQNIFTTKDLNEPWDGTHQGRKCMDGIYTYKIRAVGMNGEGRKEYIGRVALIK